MSIQCKICNVEFQKLITSTHLKKHGTTTAEYKTKFGDQSLASDEYRKSTSLRNSGNNNPNFGNRHTSEAKLSISKKKQGLTPWNKGIKMDNTINQKLSAILREEKYKSGTLVRKKQVVSVETKQKISKSMIDYLSSAPKQELVNRAKKAIETKKMKGLQIAPFKNKKHSKESKSKIADASKENNIKRRKKSQERILALIEQNSLMLTNNITDHFLSLQCVHCNSSFKRTKQMFTASKFKSNMCPKCFPAEMQRSLKEKELFSFVRSLCPDAITSYKFDNSKQELDIFIPSKNIGIEFNGLYWHSDLVLSNNGLSPKKDHQKYEMITTLGIRCIVILEDEWEEKQEIVKARLTNILGKNSKKIYARKCVVKEISSKEASNFCRLYHIQGAGRSNYRLGLYLDSLLIAVMTFSKTNISRKMNVWELNRFCTIPNCSVVGGASKLLAFFERECKPDNLTTYADRRWSHGELYERLGFEFKFDTVPNYWYFRPNEFKRYHRYALRKTNKDDHSLTEWENRINQGWNRIWDCGSKKFIKRY